MLALTSSRSSSSPGVECNLSNVTCFDLIRSYYAYWWGDKKWKKTLESSVCSYLMDSSVTSTQPTIFFFVAQLKISEASEKYLFSDSIYLGFCALQWNMYWLIGLSSSICSNNGLYLATISDLILPTSDGPEKKLNR